MILNEAGAMVQDVWYGMKDRFKNLVLDEHIVMPNHFHGVIVIGQNNVGAPLVGAQDIEKQIATEQTATKRISMERISMERRAPTRGAPTIGDVIGAFKSITTTEYIRGVRGLGWTPFSGKLWQRNYFERVIRDDDELASIREYINNNPINWADDKENPETSKSLR